jgi:FkbM family methyltransferase
LLLDAGYHFVYFDGLNRFYVSEERQDLKRYFSVPVNASDRFRDHEAVRLSNAVAVLERDKAKHEVPRLGSCTHACDPKDAAGLLRIVEMQASDLVRLRRALSSALSRGSHEFEFTDWVRSAALAELSRTQDAITQVIERSRWRHLGLHLGLAKQAGWETSHWQTNLIKSSTVPRGDGEDEAPPVAKVLRELERLDGLLDGFRRSRWRKLGHQLGLAKRLPWELGQWKNALLVKPLPEVAAAQHSHVTAESEALRSNHDRFVEVTNQRFVKECQEFATDVILDIGANTGQFAQDLRAQGYHGHIVSFEPLSEAHASLVAAASSDPLWDIADRCAVGASEGSAENSYSSSLLPMLDLHREAAPQSEYLGKEHRPIITLDAFMERTFSDPTTLFGIKIDTQGYEAEVLAGLKRNHDRVKVILCEISVAPLYAHGPTMNELCHLLAELNYRCVALSPELEDPRTGELLQVNGVFVKRS